MHWLMADCQELNSKHTNIKENRKHDAILLG